MIDTVMLLCHTLTIKSVNFWQDNFFKMFICNLIILLKFIYFGSETQLKYSPLFHVSKNLTVLVVPNCKYTPVLGVSKYPYWLYLSIQVIQ